MSGFYSMGIAFTVSLEWPGRHEKDPRPSETHQPGPCSTHPTTLFVICHLSFVICHSSLATCHFPLPLASFTIRCWTLDVRCWTFIFFSALPILRPYLPLVTYHLFFIRCWTLDVGCSMFIFSSSSMFISFWFASIEALPLREWADTFPFRTG